MAGPVSNCSEKDWYSNRLNHQKWGRTSFSEIYNIDYRRKLFEDQIPYRTYSAGGSVARLKPLTYAEYDIKKRESARFRRLYARGKVQLLDKNW